MNDIKRDTDHEAAIEKHARELLNDVHGHRLNVIEDHMRSLLTEVAPPAVESGEGYPKSPLDICAICGREWDDHRACDDACPVSRGAWADTKFTEPAPSQPAPTPTDVSAAARQAAEGIERDLERNGRALFPNGKRDVIAANIQALLSTQRATDRQRIAELEAALKEYGDHKRSCQIYTSQMQPCFKCTCGFDKTRHP